MINTYATRVKDKIIIIKGVRCTSYYCNEYGCCFPNCAKLSEEQFNSLEEAKNKYPDLKIV